MTFLRLSLKIVLTLIAGFMLFGCEKNPVLARVNGEAITQKDINALLKHAGVKEAEKQAGEMHKEMQQELVNQLINEKLVIQEAKKQKITADKNEIMQAYNNIVRMFQKEEDYLKKLKEKGLSKDMILKSIEKDITRVKLIDSLSKDITVSDKALQDYYKKNAKLFIVAEQMKLSIIKVPGIEDAKNVMKELDKGAGFEDIAKKYPAGHTAPMGGETGWVTPDTFPSDIAKEISKIKTGTFGGPIKGKEGYYFIKVQEKKEKKTQSFNEAKESVRHILLQQKKMERYNAWLQDARKNAKIEMLQKG